MDHTERNWDRYDFNYISKLLNSISKSHSFFEYSFNHVAVKSIQEAKEEFLKMRKNFKKKICFTLSY